MRKLYLLIFVAASVLYGCSSTNSDNLTTDMIKDNATADNPVGDSSQMAQIKFTEYEHNFGTISEGEVVEWNFKFKNIGKSNLLITEAHGDCGCTVPVYPKEPIKPDAESVMTVSFNSSGKPGENTKRVTVTTNGKESNAYLTIKASVIPKKR